jgi:hypothetical protein
MPKYMMRGRLAGKQLDVSTIKGQWRKVYEAGRDACTVDLTPRECEAQL